MRHHTSILLTIIGCAALMATDCAAQTVVITTLPRFEQHGEVTYLIIGDTNHDFTIIWGMLPDTQFIPVSLDTNRVYTFTLAQKTHSTVTFPELCQVQFGGQTIYDIERCEVHKIHMDFKEVRISYGYVRRRPGVIEPSPDTEHLLFPHHREYSHGGCAVSDDSPKTERIYVCSECKKAYEKWKSEHKATK